MGLLDADDPCTWRRLSWTLKLRAVRRSRRSGQGVWTIFTPSSVVKNAAQLIILVKSSHRRGARRTCQAGTSGSQIRDDATPRRSRRWHNAHIGRDDLRHAGAAGSIDKIPLRLFELAARFDPLPSSSYKMAFSQ